MRQRVYEIDKQSMNEWDKNAYIGFLIVLRVSNNDLIIPQLFNGSW